MPLIPLYRKRSDCHSSILLDLIISVVGLRVVSVADVPLLRFLSNADLHRWEVWHGVERLAILEPLGEVRIYYCRHAVAATVDLALLNQLGTLLAREPSVEEHAGIGVRDVRTVRLENVMLDRSLLAVIFGVEVWGVPHEGDVGKRELAGLGEEVPVLFESLLERHSDVVVPSRGAQFDGDVVAEDGDEGFENFKTEARAVLDAAAVFVGALV